jgi:hypothetical protein
VSSVPIAAPSGPRLAPAGLEFSLFLGNKPSLERYQ